MARPYLLIRQLQCIASPKGMWSILHLNRIVPWRVRGDGGAARGKFYHAHLRYRLNTICVSTVYASVYGRTFGT